MKIEDAYKFNVGPLSPSDKGMGQFGVVYRGFEWALVQLRNGHKVQREGWNSKDMYITLQAGYLQGIPINSNTAKATGINQGTVCRFSPYVMMKTADVLMPTFVPWVPSQSDILRLDWVYYIHVVQKGTGHDDDA